MKWWLTVLMVCTGSCALGAEPADTGQGFERLHRRLVELGNCKFELPMRGDFRFALSDSDHRPLLAYFHGKLIPGKTERVGETEITFSCEDAEDRDALRDFCIQRTDGRWTSTDCNESGTQEPIRFNGPNWDGLGLVWTMTAVPEDERAKGLMFCLIRDPVALCLTADSLQYEVRPKEDALPYVLDYVRHITFVDEGAPASRPTDTSGVSK